MLKYPIFLRVSFRRSPGSKAFNVCCKHSAYNRLVYDVQCDECYANFHSKCSIGVRCWTDGITNRHLYRRNLVIFLISLAWWYSSSQILTSDFKSEESNVDHLTFIWFFSPVEHTFYFWMSIPHFSLQWAFNTWNVACLFKYIRNSRNVPCIRSKHIDAMEISSFDLYVCTTSDSDCTVFCE